MAYRNENLTDRTGSPVLVSNDETRQAYTVTVEGNTVGRAFFVKSKEDDKARIFYHTEVEEEYGGRGLAGLLVQESLTDSREKGATVVPVCPVYVKYLEKHGETYTNSGGTFRKPSLKELQLAKETFKAEHN